MPDDVDSNPSEDRLPLWFISDSAFDELTRRTERRQRAIEDLCSEVDKLTALVKAAIASTKPKLRMGAFLLLEDAELGTRH